MPARALLIGSQTYDLAGVHNDVELMTTTLEALGFETRVRVDETATRDAILEAYGQLIEDTPAGSTDPVVVYYSGHGGRRELGADENGNDELRYIVPFDAPSSTDSDFRGILAEELSDLQTSLTGRTTNVVTILDCCFAGTMSRGEATLKSVPRPREIPIDAALARRVQRNALVPVGAAEANLYAVRVIAGNPRQSAYEAVGVRGVLHGRLTENLVDLLTGLGDRRVSWRTVGELLRSRVLAEQYPQRPDIEGPADRLVFSLQETVRPAALPIRVVDGCAVIENSDLLGVTTGDTYAILSVNEAGLGSGHVSRVADGRAVLQLDPPGILADLAGGGLADPRTRRRQQPVRLDLPDPLRAALEPLIATSSGVRLASADDGLTPTVVDGGGFIVLDAAASRINLDPFPASTPAGALLTLACLERIATAERLLGLQSPLGERRLPGTLRVELIRHGPGTAQPVASGERLYEGDLISIRLTNETEEHLFVAVYDIDTVHRVAMRTDSPGGVPLDPGHSTTIGGPAGRALRWDPTPRDGERRETFVAIAATGEQPFGLLANTRGEGAPPPTNELQALLSEAMTGTRGYPGAEADPVDYLIEATDFYLVPGARPDLAEPSFALDVRPSPDRLMSTSRGAGPPAGKVAIRLKSLRVNQNKALFRATVRVDALVITVTADGVVAMPFTERFPGIADGELIPVDRLQLFNGDVTDFVDLAIWVNRDDSKGADLSTLFEKALADPTNQAALTTVGTLIAAAPTVGLVVGAAAAVSSIVRVGAQLVESAVGRHIGLYRTSFLAGEAYGLGQHPSYGTMTAQNIAFAYEIVKAD